MKKVIIITFIALIFLAGSGWSFMQYYNHRSDQDMAVSYYHLTPEEIALIQDGDIVLRHGFGLVSDLIVEQLNENYDLSHCAILCKENDSVSVIHSVSSSISPYDGVQSQELAPFIRDSHKNSVIIVRYKKKMDRGNNAGVSARAKKYLTQQIPFDESFDINDSTEFYCTELLWKCIYNEFGDDILMDHYNKRKDHMRFDTFLDTANFEIVLNHHLRKAEQNHAFQKIQSRYLLTKRPSSALKPS